VDADRERLDDAGAKLERVRALDPTRSRADIDALRVRLAAAR
jgi:hypothetical protein